jgi:hypothetical protein
MRGRFNHLQNDIKIRHKFAIHSLRASVPVFTPDRKLIAISPLLFPNFFKKSISEKRMKKCFLVLLFSILGFHTCWFLRCCGSGYFWELRL